MAICQITAQVLIVAIAVGHRCHYRDVGSWAGIIDRVVDRIDTREVHFAEALVHACGGDDGSRSGARYSGAISRHLGKDGDRMCGECFESSGTRRLY